MMGATERKDAKKRIEAELKNTPNTWKEFDEWVSNLQEIAAEIGEDYQDTYDNMEEGGLKERWENDHGEFRDGWQEVANDLEGTGLSDYGDTPEVEEGDDKESYWQKVEEWIEESVGEVTEKVEQYL